jgi:hypothetical protein
MGVGVLSMKIFLTKIHMLPFDIITVLKTVYRGHSKENKTADRRLV